MSAFYGKFIHMYFSTVHKFNISYDQLHLTHINCHIIHYHKKCVSPANRRGRNPGSQKLSSALAPASNDGLIFPRNLPGDEQFRPKVSTFPLNFSKRGTHIPEIFMFLDPTAKGQKSMRTA